MDSESIRWVKLVGTVRLIVNIACLAPKEIEQLVIDIRFEIYYQKMFTP